MHMRNRNDKKEIIKTLKQINNNNNKIDKRQ